MSNSFDFNDGIVIFSDTGNIMFTSVGGIVENKKTMRKHKINKNVIHPCFENMKEFTNDEFWLNWLTRCSKNIFPNKNFKFTNSILYYKIKNNKHKDQIYINEEDLENSFQQLKKFFREKGTKPASEVNDTDIFVKRDKIEINTWKDIKKERKGDKLLNYIRKQQNKYNLNEFQISQLRSLINVGLAGDIFNHTNIIIEEEEIKEIKYLLWNEKEKEFYIDIYNIPLKNSKTVKIKEDPNYYTYNSYTNDNHLVTREAKSVDIGKIFEKFLDNFYNKKN